MKSDYGKGIYDDIGSFLLVFFKDERIRLIFTILWHTYRKRVLGKGNKEKWNSSFKMYINRWRIGMCWIRSFLGMSKGLETIYFH